MPAASEHDHESAEGAGHKDQQDEILRLFTPNLRDTSFPAGPEIDPCNKVHASKKRKPPRFGPLPSTVGTRFLHKKKFQVRMKTGILHHDFIEYV